MCFFLLFLEEFEKAPPLHTITLGIGISKKKKKVGGVTNSQTIAPYFLQHFSLSVSLSPSLPLHILKHTHPIHKYTVCVHSTHSTPWMLCWLLPETHRQEYDERYFKSRGSIPSLPLFFHLFVFSIWGQRGIKLLDLLLMIFFLQLNTENGEMVKSLTMKISNPLTKVLPSFSQRFSA